MESSQEERTYRLEHDSIPRLLLHYTLPAVVGTMVNALYNIVDRIFIGQGVGPDAITGLTLTFPITIFMLAFGMLVGVGASARVSILMGQGRIDDADRILGNAILLTFLFHILVMIPTIIYMNPLLRAFGANSASLPYAKEYLIIIVPGNILANLSFGYNAIMRASGYPFKAMITMLIGAVINTILDYLFIMKFHWGIQGAAWATIIAMAISATYVMSHFFDKKSIVRFRRKNIKFSTKQIIAICSIGIAPFSVQLIGSLTNIVFNRSFEAYTTSILQTNMTIAAYGILNSFAMLGVMLMLGVAQGMQPIVGFNFGSARYDRVIKTFKISSSINFAIAGICLCLTLGVPSVVSALFTNDKYLISLSAHALRTCLLGFVFVAFQITSTQFFQSIGMGIKATILSVARQLFFLLPLLCILPKYLGLEGIWYTLPISDTMSGVLAFVMISLQMRWFHNRIKLQNEGL